MEKSVSAYYNGIAEGYNELYAEEQHQKIIACQEWLPQSLTVLDAGGGTGLVYSYLEKRKNTIIGLDISEKMLRYYPGKHTVCASLAAMPFPDEYFEGFVCFSVLQDIDDIEQAIAELKRVCKKKSKGIITWVQRSSKHNELQKLIETSFLIVDKKDQGQDMCYHIQIV